MEARDAWLAAPCTMIETRESMLYALPPVAEAPLKLAGTANLRPADPDRPEPVTPKEARAVLEAFRPYLPNIDQYEIIGSAVGFYADPPDKTFIVERCDRAVVVSGCGGRMFKFAPLLAGDIAAVLTVRLPAPSSIAGEHRWRSRLKPAPIRARQAGQRRCVRSVGHFARNWRAVVVKSENWNARFHVTKAFPRTGDKINELGSW